MNFAQFVKSKVLKRITEIKAYTIIIIVQGHRKENCSGEAQGPQKPFVKLKVCAHN